MTTAPTRGLHHVGHIVRDMDEAMELYRRLGFTVAPAAYPLVNGVPFGVANAHIQFPGNFVELVAVIGDDDPAPPVDEQVHMRAAGSRGWARPIPIQVPPDRVPALMSALRATADNIAAFLKRFQGLHIAIFDTADLDATAARLEAAGFTHGGIHAVQRPIERSGELRMEPARFLELNHPGLPDGQVPEGRVGFAENAPAAEGEPVEHANGAVALTSCVLCVDDTDATEVEQRHARYLNSSSPNPGRPPEVTVLTASALDELLPGEHPPALPAFAAYTVEVRDLAATERLLRANHLQALRTAAPDSIFVPSHTALGVAVVFRQQG